MQSPLRETMDELDSQGFNCLYYATYHKNLSIVALLKKYNVAYARDSKGTSCLHVAIQRGHQEIVEFLLNKTVTQVVNT